MRTTRQLAVKMQQLRTFPSSYHTSTVAQFLSSAKIKAAAEAAARIIIRFTWLSRYSPLHVKPDVEEIAVSSRPRQE